MMAWSAFVLGFGDGRFPKHSVICRMLRSLKLAALTNSRHLNRLQPLCRREKLQPLWNQANPASFSKMPGCGVGHPERNYGTPRVWVSRTVLRDTAGGISTSGLSGSTLLTILLGEPISSPFCLISDRSSISFRISTCKSVSKQTTLTPFIINTYEKPGEGGGSVRPTTP